MGFYLMLYSNNRDGEKVILNEYNHSGPKMKKYAYKMLWFFELGEVLVNAVTHSYY